MKLKRHTYVVNDSGAHKGGAVGANAMSIFLEIAQPLVKFWEKLKKFATIVLA